MCAACEGHEQPPSPRANTHPVCGSSASAGAGRESPHGAKGMAFQRLARHAKSWSLGLALACAAGCVKEKGVRWRAPAFSKAWDLRVGSGAEYRVSCSYAATCVIDLAVVGEEPRRGGKMYWLEISSRLPGSPEPFVNKALFYREGDSVVFVRAITQLPGRPAMELPRSWLPQWTRGELAAATGFIEPYTTAGFGTAPSPGTVTSQYVPGFFGPATGLSEIPKAVPVREEWIGVPAGRYRAQLWSMHASAAPWLLAGGSVRVYIAREAGPFGIVKASFGEAGTYALPSAMLLTRVLSGAKDAIVSKPLSARPDVLWGWIWDQWARGRPALCLPQLGLPEPGAPG